MPIIRSLQRGRRLAAAVYSLTAIAFAVMYIAMPYHCDDFWYMGQLIDYVFYGKEGFPAGGILSVIRWHYLYDNARLANIVYATVMLFPRWIPAILTSLLSAATIIMLARVAGLRRDMWKGAVWLCFLYTVFLPWPEYLFAVCHQFNYAWAAALSLFAVCLFFREGRTPVWLMAVTGLLAGAWHEGFSVPLLSGFVVVALVRRGRFADAPRLVLLASLAAGIAWLMLAPPFFGRADSPARALADPDTWLRCMRFDILYTLFALMALVAVFIPRGRRRLVSPLTIFLLVSGGCAFGIHMHALFCLRAGFWAELAAVAGIVRLWPALFAPLRAPRLSAVASAAAAGFLALHLIVACAMTVIMNREFNRIFEQYIASPDGRIFVDLTHDFEAPLLALGKPSSLHMETALAWHLRPQFHVAKPLLAVPSELAHVTGDSGEAVGGRPGLRRLGNLCFIPADKTDFMRDRMSYIPVTATFGDTAFGRSIMAVPFVSQADGQEYFYIFIDDRMPFARLWPINAVEW